MAEVAHPSREEIAAEIARFYDLLERQVEGAPVRPPRLLAFVNIVAGAFALGVLSAGLSLFAVFITLNLFFHFAPS